MKKILFTACFTILYVSAFTQTYKDYISTGLDAYARSDWQSAVLSFQKAMEVSNDFSEEPLYWLIMAKTSAQSYKHALSDAALFLQKYPASSKAAEVMYQQGRIYCLCAEHEKSINTLYAFLRKYPNHRQIPSAYYWIGENLYMAGRLQDARIIFSRIIIDYPSSAKSESARYKIALIDQASTQDELLKLLKISHEELLKLSEEYERTKKNYEQTILSYQKQLGANNRDEKIAELSEKLQLEYKKNEELYDKLVMLEMKNQELLTMLAELNSNVNSVEVSASSEIDYSNVEKRREALETLREKARVLQNIYDKLLEENKR